MNAIIRLETKEAPWPGDPAAPGYTHAGCGPGMYHTEVRFPELFPARLFNGSVQGKVIDIRGQRYKLTAVAVKCIDEVPQKVTLILEPTDEPESDYDPMPEFRTDHDHYGHFGGQPYFIQNPVYPVYKGRAVYHFLSLNTGWGDAGNINIFVALDADSRPCEAWMEAGCC